VKLRKAQLLSLLIHAGVVFALLHIGAVIQEPLDRKQPRLEWNSIKIEYDLPKGNAKGGGAGADRTPPKKGAPPRTEPRPFLPPTTRTPDHQPLLPVEPTILGAESTPVPVAIFGDPTGIAGPPSDGFGGRSGIGTGRDDGGVGPNAGRSFGDGPGGGQIGGSATLGLSSYPVVIVKVEPEFTEEARKARVQGTVVLLVDINERGEVSNIRVRTPLGLGLDEKAIEAVKKWKFKPGTRNGVPVSTPALVEVNFRLL
jgi:TonB family protein